MVLSTVRYAADADYRDLLLPDLVDHAALLSTRASRSIGSLAGERPENWTPTRNRCLYLSVIIGFVSHSTPMNAISDVSAWKEIKFFPLLVET